MNNVLFTSDILYDTDFGLVKMIGSLPFKDYFRTDYLSLLENDNVLIYNLTNILPKNPFEYILKDEYRDSAESLYEECVDNEIDIVLDYGRFTDILRMVETYNLSTSIEVTIACRNEQEKQVISSRIKCKTIIQKDYRIDIDSYDSIFTKRFSTVENFLPISGKNFYIGNIHYNLESGQLSKPLEYMSDKIKDGNNLYLIDIYNIDKPRG